MGIEWILWPVIWSCMFGAVKITNDRADAEKLAKPLPEIHYDHGSED